MQILPSSSPFESAGIYSSSDFQSDGNFMQAMEEALDSVQTGEEVSVSSALEDKNGPLVESPYTRHTTDGVTYTLSEVCFTKQELQELRLALVKEGAPEASLKDFDVLVDQPAGATLAQVMASLIGKKSTGQLTDEDEHAITAFLGQLDPSGQLAADVLGLMQQGNGSGALDLIQDALGKLGSGDGIDVDLDGILALGRGLGLNVDSMRGLATNFGRLSGMRLNGEQFDALMGPAKNQFLEEAANAEKLDAALEKTLKPIISKARDRMEKEKAAASLQDRRVEQSRILIDKTVQERSRQMMDATVTGETEIDAKQGKAQVMDQEGMPQDVMLKQNQQLDKNDAMAAMDKHAGRGAQKDSTGSFQNSGDNSDNSGLKDQGRSDSWLNLLGNVETKPATSLNATSFVYSMLQPDAYNAENAGSTLDMPYLAAQLSRQVDQGMLTNMKNGATRLDLQLHPSELGALAITLVARNGEITAKIRSEKSETAEMLNSQLDALKVNLEQQGIKIDNIEVQLENRQEAGQDILQDMNQHNARQEEDARRQELARLRNLATIRNLSRNSENSVLAQSVHNMEHAARYAGHALNVVA